jgi:hypothetical protein
VLAGSVGCFGADRVPRLPIFNVRLFDVLLATLIFSALS